MGYKWPAIIGGWQILGGTLGGVYLLDALAGTGLPRGRQVVLAAAIAVACGASIFAGVQLLRARPAGVILSLAVQGLQTVGVAMDGAAAQFTLTPSAFLTVVWGARTSLEVGWRPRLMWLWGADAQVGGASIAINLLALGFFFILLFRGAGEPRQERSAA